MSCHYVSRLTIFLLSIFCVLPLSVARADQEFTVLVYNVENLFDLDGIAGFDQFRQVPDENGLVYGPRQLLTKLEKIRQTLAAVNDGAGPEVIAFQEFELDRTVFSTVYNYEGFLRVFADTTVEAMLLEDFDNYIAGLPVEALLLKHLEDNGMTGYQIAQPDPKRLSNPEVHKNVVFSRFPIVFVEQWPAYDARDVLEVHLDVGGKRLIVFNNHWKSGASNPETEPVRRQNAHVLRAALDRILLDNPRADVILVGDFNTNYNQLQVVEGITTSAIQSVLGSQGSEEALVEDPEVNLFNLWFELPFEQRGSEVWRGKWGTLMQILLTPGLYDQQGVQYVDNSFFRLILPGENVDARFGTPVDWSGTGPGAGFSDHLPVGARFRVLSEDTDGWMPVVQAPWAHEGMLGQPTIDYSLDADESFPAASSLAGADSAALAEAMGGLYLVDSVLTESRPPKVRIGTRDFEIFAEDPKAREALRNRVAGDRVRFVGELDEWRGRIQFVIRDVSWWER